MKKVVFTRVNPSTSECGFLAKPQDEKKWGAARLMGDKKKWLAVYDILKTSHVYSCSLSDYRGLKLGVAVVLFLIFVFWGFIVQAESQDKWHPRMKGGIGEPNPKPQTPNPKPQTLNPKPQTLNPKP